MSLAGFEPVIPAIKRPQSYVLDPTATEIGWHDDYECIIESDPEGSGHRMGQVLV
jgi:hypothetical protein